MRRRIRKKQMPGWLVVLLTVAALVVLGPPLMAVLLGVLGLAVGLAVAAFKVALVVLAIYAVVVVGRSLLGEQKRPRTLVIDEPLPEKDPELQALDRELEKAMRQAGQ